jgi:hypothetical protein
MLMSVAHGEGWEVAASRAVHKLVREILDEQAQNNEKAELPGRFELLYTPGKLRSGSIAVPVSLEDDNVEFQPRYVSNYEMQSSPTDSHVVRF